MILLYIFSFISLFSMQNSATVSPIFNRENTDLDPDCSVLQTITYSENSTITLAFSEKKTKRILAVKNTNEIILLNDGKKILHKKFHTQITQIQVLWYFEKAFLLTYSKQESTETAYELNLVSLRITSLITLYQNLSIYMLADPLQGTLTLSSNNKFLIINTAYSDSNEPSNLYHETANCSNFENVSFLVSSSQIDGYSKLQTYYLITDTNEYIECYIFENECDCIPVTNKTILEGIEFLRNQYDNSKICQTTVNEILIKPGVFLNPAIHTQELKPCLRICPLPEWKASLYNGINTRPHSWNKLPLETDQHQMECINRLQISDFIEAVGFARSADNSSSSRFLFEVNYRKKIMTSLVSKECANFETGYKYTVKYRQLKAEIENGNNSQTIAHDLDSINTVTTDLMYESKSSLESSIILELNNKFSYEIIIQVQTPFDTEPYTIGSYLVYKGIQTNLVDPDFKKIMLKPIPFILDDYTSQAISDNSMTMSLLFSSNYMIREVIDELVNLKIVLTDIKNNETEVKEVQANNIDDFQVEKFYKISFEIEGLIENNPYRLRVLNNNQVVSEVASISNLVI